MIENATQESVLKQFIVADKYQSTKLQCREIGFKTCVMTEALLRNDFLFFPSSLFDIFSNLRWESSQSQLFHFSNKKRLFTSIDVICFTKYKYSSAY